MIVNRSVARVPRLWLRVWVLLLMIGLLFGPPGSQSAVALADACPLPGGPVSFPRPSASTSLSASLGGAEAASHVQLDGQRLAYRYIVNGQEEVIRGMGYNPSYAALPPDERRARYQRDFSAMAAAGVNTVFGWNPLEFDGLTLDVAAENGLGVALPYDLDWQLDYADPAVQVDVGTDVLNWVARYKEHPALRMWAIGNEAFFQLVPPTWCERRATAAEAVRAEAFGRFYATLIDQVHELDPRHPILYREAEDSFVQWMKAALAGNARPWFIYGLNAYTPRLPEILDAWPGKGLDAALMVSEFAPGPESRPGGYRDYWAAVRSYPGRVLGGAVYVWFTEGPEEIDHQYGLVDSNGQPVDGALDAVRQIFHGG